MDRNESEREKILKKGRENEIVRERETDGKGEGRGGAATCVSSNRRDTGHDSLRKTKKYI